MAASIAWSPVPVDGQGNYTVQAGSTYRAAVVINGLLFTISSRSNITDYLNGHGFTNTTVFSGSDPLPDGWPPAPPGQDYFVEATATQTQSEAKDNTGGHAIHINALFQAIQPHQQPAPQQPAPPPPPPVPDPVAPPPPLPPTPVTGPVGKPMSSSTAGKGALVLGLAGLAFVGLIIAGRK